MAIFCFSQTRENPLNNVLITRIHLCLLINTTKIRQDGGTNQNDWGTNGSNCGNAPLVCMLEMSSSEEQVQEGATSRYLDN